MSSGPFKAEPLDFRAMQKRKVYLTLPPALTRINATTALGLVRSNYQVAKIHQYSLQSEADAQTVYFYEVGPGTQLGQKWVFNAREGVISPFSKEPLIVPSAPGRDIGLNLANSTYVNFAIVYTNEDESVYRT
jgi:hypothetical protein